MRTTITLPDELHRVVLGLAHDRGQTLSQAVVDLLRRTLEPQAATPRSVDARTGLAVVSIGRTVTTEDVRSLEDDA